MADSESDDALLLAIESDVCDKGQVVCAMAGLLLTRIAFDALSAAFVLFCAGALVQVTLKSLSFEHRIPVNRAKQYAHTRAHTRTHAHACARMRTRWADPLRCRCAPTECSLWQWKSLEVNCKSCI